MAKPFKISFSVKSAEQVAKSLGVSETRKNRIFKIVDKTVRKSGSSPVIWATKKKSKARPVGKNTHLTLRSRQRSNVKTAR